MKERMKVDEILKQAKKLGVYKRVSTNEQDNEKRQNQALESFLDQNGISLKDTKKFEDTKSAYRLPYNLRPDFVKLIKAAKAKEIDGVVVSDIDRISRQTSEHFELRKLFEELGLPVIIASKGEVYGKPDNRDLVKQLIEDGFTKLESDNISVRTRDALEKVRREEKFAGGIIPYGYKANKKDGKVDGVAEIPKEIEIIKKVFRLYQGGKTFKDIAEGFKEDGAPRRLKRDGNPKEWCAKKVKYILSNPFYTGNFVYNRKTDNQNFAPLADWVWVPCPWIKNPPISKEQFLTCWRRYEESKDKNRYYLHTSYYFQDILRCSCGETMRGVDQRTKSKRNDKKKDGYRYYRCLHCGMKIQVQSLHKLFKTFYYGLSLPYENVFYEIQTRLQADCEAITKQLGEWRNQLDREEQILLEINRLPEIKKNKNFLLSESDNAMDIAAIIGKKQTKKAIQTLKEQIQSGEKYVENLNMYLNSEEDLKAAIFEVLEFSKEVDEDTVEEEGTEEDQKNSQLMRSVVLLMVKECQLISDNEVELTFFMMPNKSLIPVVTKKRAE
jgi:site-specific DNA recombinase